MLQQEPSSQETLTSAQIRVTPEELAHAIASLEAKKAEEARLRDEEARRNAGTLSLHEAVDNLNLEFTEEQLWEEVKKERDEEQRRRSTDNVLTPTFTSEPRTSAEDIVDDNAAATNFEEKHPRFETSFTGAIVFCIILAVAIIALTNSYSSTQVSPISQTSPFISRTSQPVPYGYPLFLPGYGNPRQIRYGMAGRDLQDYLSHTKGINPYYRLFCVDSVGISHPPSLTMALRYPQTAIPDGYSITSRIALNDIAGAKLILNNSDVVFLGVNSPLLRFEFMSALPARTVTTTRHSGHLYLRCWVRRDEIAALKSGQACSLFTSTDTKDAPPQAELVGVTLPFELPHSGITTSRPTLWSAVDGGETGRGQSRVAIPHGVRLALDKHAWEKW